MGDESLLRKLTNIFRAQGDQLGKFAVPDHLDVETWDNLSTGEKQSELAWALIRTHRPDLVDNIPPIKAVKRQNKHRAVREICLRKSPRFFGEADEEAYFKLLREIPCVQDVADAGLRLIVDGAAPKVQRHLLAAVLKRYGVYSQENIEGFDFFE